MDAFEAGIVGMEDSFQHMQSELAAFIRWLLTEPQRVWLEAEKKRDT